MKAAAVVIISVLASLPCGNAAVMEAMIHIDSDNFRMTSFLERFKRFIAKSHSESSLDAPWMDKLVHRNDTFQANYDFSRNLLTMSSSYSLMLNGTHQKISDVKITINFRFNQQTNERIIVKDLDDENDIPRIEYKRNRNYNREFDREHEGDGDNISVGSTLLGKFLSPIVEFVEPIIVAFIHIIVNGVLGHVLATAFDQLYNGRLITI